MASLLVNGAASTLLVQNGVKHNDDVIEAEEIEIPVPWGHISGVWWGPRDVKPIICLHGWQDNAGTFERLAPLLLPGGHSLLALDLMGHGRSSHFPKGQFYFLYWDGVMLVRRVCRHFGWDKVTLLGHSLGGAIAFLYAASYPNEVIKLMCIDIASPVLRPDEKVVDEASRAMERFLDYEEILDKNLPSYEYEEVVELVMKAYANSLTRESCEVLLKRGLRRANDGIGFHFARDVRLKIFGLGSIPRSTVLQFCKQIKCEVLNIKGIPGNVFDDESFYYEVIETMKPSAKRVVFHEVEGTHHLHLNTPERIMPHIERFLQEDCDSNNSIPPEN